MVGNELLHEPYASFRQSKIKAQTADVHYAKKISALMLAQTPMGYPMRLPSSNNGVTLAMTHIVAEEDTELTFVVRDGVRAVSIDGQELDVVCVRYLHSLVHAFLDCSSSFAR